MHAQTTAPFDRHFISYKRGTNMTGNIEYWKEAVDDALENIGILSVLTENERGRLAEHMRISAENYPQIKHKRN